VTHRIFPLDPTSYRPHPTHTGDRVWAESNCYVDLWTELLHGAGFEPLAAMAFTIGVDLEGDQWTFFKYPLADLYTLYGVEVIELNIWKSVIDNVEEQLRLGRPSVVEADAWFLPDTRGTTYRTEHVKTAIGVQMLDRQAGRMGYFHNAGYYELTGEDFTGTFRLAGPHTGPEFLLPYIEVVKLGAGPPARGSDLIAASLGLLGEHLRKAPRSNPFARFAERFREDLEWLAGATLPQFHQYAFAGLRQCGASFEFAGLYLRWLEAQGASGLTHSADAFLQLADSAKALQFKTARFVNTRKPFDPGDTLAGMARAWDSGMNGLVR